LVRGGRRRSAGGRGGDAHTAAGAGCDRPVRPLRPYGSRAPGDRGRPGRDARRSARVRSAACGAPGDHADHPAEPGRVRRVRPRHARGGRRPGRGGAALRRRRRAVRGVPPPDGDVPGAGPPADDPRHAAVLLRTAHAAARPCREGRRPCVPVAGRRPGGRRRGPRRPPPPGGDPRGAPGPRATPRPTRLLAHAERVGDRAFQWRAADRMDGAVDLAGTTPAEWTFLDPRSRVNYTGWWGTLFPPGTAQRLGLPAPLFLKWDDAEYGLRATRQGFDHAVLPGTSVHHPPWTAFRTQMTWTARVLHRNRLAIAAAY